MIQGCAYRGPFRRVVVRKQFIDFFPSDSFHTYDAFVSLSGENLKSEPRTEVVLLERRPTANRPAERFIIKHYYYPFLPRTRTWYHHAKAEHEFRSLLKVAELGLHAAEPAAFGVRRTVTGCVLSCFIVTRYVEDAVTLEQWAEQVGRSRSSDDESSLPVCQALGEAFRRLHVARFFLFTAKPENILIRRTGESFETIFIDLPYALRIRWGFLSRYAQAFDLAAFLSNAARLLPLDQVDTFYRGYLPDPLGRPPADLFYRLADAIRWRRNETPVSRVVHRFRRSVKEYYRWLISRPKTHGTEGKLAR
jgi:hypothetical protein